MGVGLRPENKNEIGFFILFTLQFHEAFFGQSQFLWRLHDASQGFASFFN